MPRAGVLAGSWYTQALEELDAGRGSARAVRDRRRSEVAATSGVVLPIPSKPSAISSACWRVGSAPDDLIGYPAQVLDEQDAQADRDGPQLTDGQGLDPLVGDDEAPQALRIEPAVGVGDVRPGQAEDARITLEVAVGELGQLAVVVGRARSSRISRRCSSTNVEVVDEPLGGGGDRAFVLESRGPGSGKCRGAPGPLSATRGLIARPVRGSEVTGWAAARVSPCCSRRSMLKSSATMGSSSATSEPIARRRVGRARDGWE